MSDSLYGHVFAAAPAGIAVHDGTSPRFEAVNEAYAEALGYDPPALTGRSLTDLAVEDAAELSAALDRASDGAHDGVLEQVEARLEGTDGSQRPVSSSRAPHPARARAAAVPTADSTARRDRRRRGVCWRFDWVEGASTGGIRSAVRQVRGGVFCNRRRDGDARVPARGGGPSELAGVSPP